jgi:hypothetical protein
MRRAGKALLIGGVVVALGAAGTVYAYAGGWTVDGQASFTAKVAKMPRGVEPSVAKQSGQAVVSWSAQEIVEGAPMDHYVVTAHSVSEPPRPDIARTVPAAGNATESVTFTVAEVAGGKWRWSVTPRYRVWTGESSRLSERLNFPAAPAARVAASTPPPAPVDGEVITPPRSPATTTSPPASPTPERTSASPAAEPDPETPPPAPAGSAAPPEESAVPAPTA